MSARLTHYQTLSARIGFVSDILSGLASSDRTFGFFIGKCPRFSAIGAEGGGLYTYTDINHIR